MYRLPTEEEWEYICRGGPISQSNSAFDFTFATSKTNLTPVRSNDLSSHQANFDGDYPAGIAKEGPYLRRTSPVGSYLPNPLGIYDMHGNVLEWTSTSEGSCRMSRGGSWSSYGECCSAASRYRISRAARYYYLGFRLLAVPIEE